MPGLEEIFHQVKNGKMDLLTFINTINQRDVEVRKDTTRLLAGKRKKADYFASTDWIDGKHVWIVGKRTGGILATSPNHQTLIEAAQAAMRQNGINKLTLVWDNDGKIETITATPNSKS